MGDEYLVHILGKLYSIRLNPVYSGRFPAGLDWNIWFNWDHQPLLCTIHSSLLIQTKEVLQGVSGGALGVVR